MSSHSWEGGISVGAEAEVTGGAKPPAAEIAIPVASRFPYSAFASYIPNVGSVLFGFIFGLVFGEIDFPSP